MFQSPSRGGHLRGFTTMPSGTVAAFSFSPLHEGDTSVAHRRAGWRLRTMRVSVPFTRGTPPWPLQRAHRRCPPFSFQSPSRGGHLRGEPQGAPKRKGVPSFSPLHEGDTSVAIRARCFARQLDRVSVPFTRGTPPWRLHISYSHIELYALRFAKLTRIAFLLKIGANPRGFVYHTSAQ